MTDTVETSNELELLKERADDLGIKYRANVTVEKLREMVNEVMAPKTESAEETPETLTAKQKQLRDREAKRKECMKLIRVNITCMDPKKKEWEGEVIKVISGITGTVTKYVAFGTEEGYHIPQIILNHMKGVMYQGFRTKKDKFGNDTPQAYQAPAYNIQILPPLTEEELAELRKSQLARGM